MTRYRVTFSGLTILAIAVSAALDVGAQNKQSARARMIMNGSVAQYCDGYSLTASSDGRPNHVHKQHRRQLRPTRPPTPRQPTPTPHRHPLEDVHELRFRSRSRRAVIQICTCRHEQLRDRFARP
jgi:hypothetical protein